MLYTCIPFRCILSLPPYYVTTVMKDRLNKESVMEIRANEEPSSDAERPLRQIGRPKREEVMGNGVLSPTNTLTSGM